MTFYCLTAWADGSEVRELGLPEPLPVELIEGFSRAEEARLRRARPLAGSTVAQSIDAVPRGQLDLFRATPGAGPAAQRPAGPGRGLLVNLYGFGCQRYEGEHA